MNNIKYEHIVLIRFDYPEDYPHLEERRKLFKEYCERGILSQTNKNFKVFFIGKDYGLGYPTLKYKDYNFEGLDYLLITRLDSDDEWEPYFIEEVQQAFKDNIDRINQIGKMIIDTKGSREDIREGKIWIDKRYNEHFSSPFVTLVQKKEFINPKEIMTCPHNEMGNNYPYYQIQNLLWTQIIHETNKTMNKYTPKQMEQWGELIYDKNKK